MTFEPSSEGIIQMNKIGKMFEILKKKQDKLNT